MIRRKADQKIEFKCIRNGNGSIGEHTHVGDNEIFYFLKGTGTYNDNGTYVKVGPGDTAICNDGELHGLVNDGDEPLEYIALILYS